MRWIAAGWVAAALGATAALGFSGAVAGRWPESVHIVGHLGLCSVLAVLVCGGVPRSAGPAARAGAALAVAMLFGAAIEAVQLRYHPRWNEVVYDLATDGLGAVAGVVVWAHLGRDRERIVAVGHLLSAVLHPLWVAPVGLTALLYSAERAPWTALSWSGTAVACLAPAVGWWGLGLSGRWWSDADLSRRTDRSSLFAIGCCCAVLFALLAARGPAPVALVAVVCVGGALIGTGITLLGLKVSGHVAIPATLGLCIGAWSDRGPALLLGIALALSWARIAAGRHQVAEVAAAWLLAAMLAVTVLA